MRTDLQRRWVAIAVATLCFGCDPSVPRKLGAFPGGGFGPGSGGLSTVTTDGVTIQGDGSSGNKVRIKAVSTDATLTGAGTVASPIGANPSSALTPDPKGYFTAWFQQKTGDSPLLLHSYYEDFLYQATLQPADYSAFPSGTGATATWLTTSGRGIMKLLGATAAGQCDWSMSSRTAGPYAVVKNLRATKWTVAYLVASGKAPASGSQVSIGMQSGSTYFGIGYVGASGANWQYVRGVDGSVAVISDTGKAIVNEAPPANTGYDWFTLRNDGTNILECVGVVAGCTESIAEANTNVPNGAGTPYLYNKGTAGDIVFLDAAVYVGE